MKIISTALLGILFFACQKGNQQIPKGIAEVEIVTIIEDSLISIRALEVLPNQKKVAFATSDGRYGMVSTLDDKEHFTYTITYDTLIPHFRSMALTSKGLLMLSVGNPALLFKANASSFVLNYKEEHEAVFYDAMTFWNDNEGIAIGDPIDDCMSIILTRDGGETWSKLSCDDLPETTVGEAAFAASDTNIAVVGNETWVATGGKASRILYSPDKGVTWDVYDTPVIQGQSTTGLYSIDFYDARNGFGIGGDYTRPMDTLANKIRTTDGGRTWQVVANGRGPGYRSCVQYVPGGKANELVAVGFNGIDYSKDAGETWTHLSEEGYYTFRFMNDSIAYAAGKGRVSKLIFK